MNFQQLIKASREGVPRAEQELYRLLYQQLFNIPLRYTRDREEATAVFNEAMLDIFNSDKQFSSETDLVRFTARVLKNKAIDTIRRTTVYRNKLTIFGGHSSKKYELNDALSSLAVGEIRNLIQQLPASQRLVFVMKEIDGFSYDQITKELSINANTARWYLAEAKKNLKKTIAKLDADHRFHNRLAQ
jgi:RNA polymerase sigma-70 factor (ECF subfamily)